MNHLRATRAAMGRIPLGLATWLILFAGCASRGDLPRTVAVSGKVTYKGQPVEGATVSFIGEGETRTATARTAADGTFHLMTLDAQGAMPGQYTVVVHKMEMPPESTKPLSMEEAAKLGNQPLPQPKRLLPAKYSDAAKSPFKFEVKEGQPNTFDLPLAD